MLLCGVPPFDVVQYTGVSRSTATRIRKNLRECNTVDVPIEHRGVRGAPAKITEQALIGHPSNFDPSIHLNCPKMPYSNEANIKKALGDYDAGAYPSYRAPAKAYDLTHTTLLRRYHGISMTRHEASKPRQILSEATEQRLKDLILWSERSGHAFTFQQLREIAGKASVASRGAPTLGIRWCLARKYLAIPATSAPSESIFSQSSDIITEKRNRLGKESINYILCFKKLGVSRFFQRHPDLRGGIGQKMEAKRVGAARWNTLRPWYNGLDALFFTLTGLP